MGYNIVIGALTLAELHSEASRFRKSIEQRGMTLNDSKTVYGVQELAMLGYFVGNARIRPDTEKSPC